MSRIRGPYVRFCERDEAVTPHPTRYGFLTKVRTSLAPRNCCPNTELLPGVGAIDTDLDPEINVNYELGARLRYGALNVEAIGFYSHYSDTGCSGNRRYLYYNEKNS